MSVSIPQGFCMFQGMPVDVFREICTRLNARSLMSLLGTRNRSILALFSTKGAIQSLKLDEDAMENDVLRDWLFKTLKGGVLRDFLVDGPIDVSMILQSVDHVMSYTLEPSDVLPDCSQACFSSLKSLCLKSVSLGINISPFLRWMGDLPSSLEELTLSATDQLEYMLPPAWDEALSHLPFLRVLRLPPSMYPASSANIDSSSVTSLLLALRTKPLEILEIPLTAACEVYRSRPRHHWFLPPSVTDLTLYWPISFHDDISWPPNLINLKLATIPSPWGPKFETFGDITYLRAFKSLPLRSLILLVDIQLQLSPQELEFHSLGLSEQSSRDINFAALIHYLPSSLEVLSMIIPETDVLYWPNLENSQKISTLFCSSLPHLHSFRQSTDSEEGHYPLTRSLPSHTYTNLLMVPPLLKEWNFPDVFHDIDFIDRLPSNIKILVAAFTGFPALQRAIERFPDANIISTSSLNHVPPHYLWGYPSPFIQGPNPTLSITESSTPQDAPFVSGGPTWQSRFGMRNGSLFATLLPEWPSLQAGWATELAKLTRVEWNCSPSHSKPLLNLHCSFWDLTALPNLTHLSFDGLVRQYKRSNVGLVFPPSLTYIDLKSSVYQDSLVKLSMSEYFPSGMLVIKGAGFVIGDKFRQLQQFDCPSLILQPHDLSALPTTLQILSCQLTGSNNHKIAVGKQQQEILKNRRFLFNRVAGVVEFLTNDGNMLIDHLLSSWEESPLMRLRTLMHINLIDAEGFICPPIDWPTTLISLSARWEQFGCHWPSHIANLYLCVPFSRTNDFQPLHWPSLPSSLERLVIRTDCSRLPHGTPYQPIQPHKGLDIRRVWDGLDSLSHGLLPPSSQNLHDSGDSMNQTIQSIHSLQSRKLEVLDAVDFTLLLKPINPLCDPDPSTSSYVDGEYLKSQYPSLTYLRTSGFGMDAPSISQLKHALGPALQFLSLLDQDFG